MNKDELLEILERNCFAVELNANDFFAWACAESVTVDYDIFIETVQKYGQAGINALLVHSKRCDPQPPMLELIEGRHKDKYYEALAWLREEYPKHMEETVCDECGR